MFFSLLEAKLRKKKVFFNKMKFETHASVMVVFLMVSILILSICRYQTTASWWLETLLQIAVIGVVAIRYHGGDQGWYTMRNFVARSGGFASV